MISRRDLIRVGVYTQMEGTFDRRGDNYRFRFRTNQISDMRELLTRVTGKEFGSEERLTVSSKNLYKNICSLGFSNFGFKTWNTPDFWSFDKEEMKEYLRSVVDSLGNIHVDWDGTPTFRIASTNYEGLCNIRDFFGGLLYKSLGRTFLQWRGEAALTMTHWLDYRFYNDRNSRGVELIRMMRWSEI